MVRVEVEVVRRIRQRVGLDAHHAEVLPVLDVALVALAPARRPGREALATDLDGQELVLSPERRAPHEAVRAAIEVRGQEIVDDDALRGGAGGPIEYDV